MKEQKATLQELSGKYYATLIEFEGLTIEISGGENKPSLRELELEPDETFFEETSHYERQDAYEAALIIINALNKSITYEKDLKKTILIDGVEKSLGKYNLLKDILLLEHHYRFPHKPLPKNRQIADLKNYYNMWGISGWCLLQELKKL